MPTVPPLLVPALVRPPKRQPLRGRQALLLVPIAMAFRVASRSAFLPALIITTLSFRGPFRRGDDARHVLGIAHGPLAPHAAVECRIDTVGPVFWQWRQRR